MGEGECGTRHRDDLPIMIDGLHDRIGPDLTSIECYNITDNNLEATESVQSPR